MDVWYLHLLRSCAAPSHVAAVHAHIVRSHPAASLFLRNSLLAAYCRLLGPLPARALLDEMPRRNAVSFNLLIDAYSRAGHTDLSLGTFARALVSGVKVDRFTFAATLSACSRAGDVRTGKAVHALAVVDGLSRGVFVSNSLISMYARCGKIGEARRVFEVAVEHDDVSWNSLISGYVRAGQYQEMLSVFGLMRRREAVHGCVVKAGLDSDVFLASAMIDMYAKKGVLGNAVLFSSQCKNRMCFRSLHKEDIVTWTSLISGCVQNERFEEALRLFQELLCYGLKPDLFTISSVMNACASLAVARIGEQIQSLAIKSGFHRFTIMGNSCIHMYARSGDVDAATQRFLEMESRDVVSWSAVISSHAQHGSARDALNTFYDMMDAKVVPNEITFLGVLACSHGGLVDEGLSLAVLLASCRIHGDMERGRLVADQIMELEPSSSASYVILYNMYLEAGELSLASKTRDLMKERGVRKEPGLSWIELRSGVHSFVAGDKSHPDSNAIYAKLAEMLSRIEKSAITDIVSTESNDISSREQNLMGCHSEKLAVAFGMIHLPQSAPIRVMKNLRVCRDCHSTMKLLSRSENREIILRDAIRFHHFIGGSCSCGDYW
ncbi:hypothetical protein PR202_gb03678 [Eleusine coracana subsp. coracana]|uniref:DYW domain-containing protein n=1 Tax=Eleusine coracana subsp. coracana TaxID=191504 RepID=A0AAV5E026_ELECO|nr:hypothetical protein PR202_gb03678 [Eleusine coracana subsp. coracana]